MQPFLQLRSIALLLIYCSMSLAAAPIDKFVVPEQSIVGTAKPVPPGELAELSISEIKNKPEFLVSSSVEWSILDSGKPRGFRTDSKGIFFAVGLKPRRLTVIAAVTHLYLVKTADGKTINEVATRSRVLVSELVVGDPPAPTPDPDNPDPPKPPPAPDFPDGKFQLSRFIYDLASKEIPAAVRVKTARAVVTAMEGINARIAAGTLTVVEEILQETRKANNSALEREGVSSTQVVKFADGLQKKLVDLDRSSKLTTFEDYQQAWKEIIDGLKAVK